MRFSVDKITDISAPYILILSAEELNRQITVLQQSTSGLFVGDTRIDFSLARIEKRLILKGSLSSTLDMQCGRCLKSFSGDMQETFSLALHLSDQPEEESREDLELEEDHINNIQVESGEVDLRPILQELVLMNMPVYVSCNEDCAGLCAHCGGDLNLTVCDCEPLPFNNRFGKLKEIKLDP